MNPGHGIVAIRFIIGIGRRREDQKLIEHATDITLDLLNFSWDFAYGGSYYFLDAHKHLPLQLEWTQKLWWTHLDKLIALARS